MIKIRFGAAVWAVLVFMLISPPLWAANFLWQVESPGGGRAYILGSIHLARAGLYPLAEPIMASFRNSRQLAVELDVEALDQAELTAYVSRHGLADDGRPPEERLSPETLEILRQSPFKTDHLKALKPWLAALTLQLDVMRQYGYGEEYGLDRFFLEEAKRRGLAIIELESLAEQMDPLAEMTALESDLFFRATVLELSELSNIMETMFEAWRNGDTEKFARIFFQEYDKYPELTPLLDRVIFRRNEKMAARIDKLLSPAGGPCFIVIGAGHLAGPGSVLELLAEKGHRLTQM